MRTHKRFFFLGAYTTAKYCCTTPPRSIIKPRMETPMLLTLFCWRRKLCQDFLYGFTQALFPCLLTKLRIHLIGGCSAPDQLLVIRLNHVQ